MKKTLFSLICLFALTLITSLSAQVDKGTVTMEIIDVSSDNPQMAAGLEMMKGTKVIVHYQDKKSVTKMNMMGGMVKMDIKMSESGKMDMFMDMMGQKMWIEATKAEMDLAKIESGKDTDFDIEYDESDTKEIAGFECYKMVLTSPDNEDFKLEAYITEEIDINAAVIQNVDITKFKGFPLEYKVDMGMMQLTFTTTEFLKTVDTAVFDIDGSGFKKMSLEDFQSQMGGMGGGFGF